MDLLKISIIKSIIFLITIFFLLLLFSSCDTNIEGDMCENYDYSDCNTSEPSTAFLYLNVLCNSDFTNVPIVIYRGDIDDNIVILYDTLKTPRATYELAVNVYYSATAEYNYGSKKIYALAGGKIKTKSKKICDSICWERENKELHLEIKNYFLGDD